MNVCFQLVFSIGFAQKFARLTWNDMRKPDKIPAVFDPVEKPATENECRIPIGVLSRQEMAKESYPEPVYIRNQS
jgi:hypothetical protein